MLVYPEDSIAAKARRNTLEFKWIAWTWLPYFVYFSNNSFLLIYVHSDVPSFELIYWLIMELFCMHVNALFVFSAVVWRAKDRVDTDWWVLGVSLFSEAFSIPVCLTTAISCQQSIFIFILLFLLFNMKLSCHPDSLFGEINVTR